jgi:putative membrane protein
MIFIARAGDGGKVAAAMKSPFGLLLRWAILALGVVIAAHVIPGIYYRDAGSLIVAVLLLSLFNAILRPILIVFTLPFILVTMGIGVFVINAFLFYLVGRMVDGFVVSGFWPALGGSLVLSLTNIIVSTLVRSSRLPPPPPPRGPGGGSEVIDI